MEIKQEKTTSKYFKRLSFWGCIIPVFVLFIVSQFFIFSYYFFNNEVINKTPPPFIAEAEHSIKPKLTQLKTNIDNKKAVESVDLDQTVMAIYSIEKALAEATDFKGLTEFIMQEESDKIAPDVLELKYRFFNVYKKLLDAEDDMEEMKSVYNVTSGTLLDLFSAVNLPTGSVDRGQVKKIWVKRLAEVKLNRDIKERLKLYQDQLMQFYFDFMAINSKYMNKWNRVCSYRDRAYLALYENDWNEVAKNAEEAVKLAPNEKEAHLLLIMSLLEKDNNSELDINQARAEQLTNDYLKKHKGYQAPALLLKGVIEAQKNNYDTALIDFDQSAAYFPKQKDLLLDRLNLYKKRQFLNNSKEGRMIINIYRGIMTGSGYFSPDFQKARVLMMQGEKDKAKLKIFDHFFRRRFQGQWDRVYTDFKFSHHFLKTGLQEIFADGDEKGKLKLDIDSAFFTNSIIVKIANNSSRDIHNMTILLCVRFTDMFKGDYICFPVGETVALLKAGDQASVGRYNINDITKERFGKVKDFKDIIEYAAVLISDEVITWLEPAQAVVKKVVVKSPDENVGTPDKQSQKITDHDIKEAVKDLTDDAVEAIYKLKDGDDTDKNKKNMEATKVIIKGLIDKSADKQKEEKDEATQKDK